MFVSILGGSVLADAASDTNQARVIIVIDHVHDPKTGLKVGEVLIDTNAPPPFHPTERRHCTDWLEWLAVMNADPAARTKGGWDEVPKIPGGRPTRWAQLVAAANAPDADPVVASLGLTP